MRTATALTLALVCFPAAAGCNAGGVASDYREQLAAMSPEEFEAYAERVELRVEAVADAVLAAGDASAEGLELIADAFDALVGGAPSIAIGALVDRLELGHYTELAIRLGAIELDRALTARGAYDADGAISPRGRELLKRVATALRDAARGSPAP